VLGLVLKLAGPERLGERTPQAVEARTGHFHDAADIGRLGAVEKQVGLERIRVDAVIAVQQFQRDQRIEKIARRARMQPKPVLQRRKVGRSAGQCTEHTEFDGAQKRLRGPEAQANLHDMFRRDGAHQFVSVFSAGVYKTPV
jgi:hypothetical protein